MSGLFKIIIGVAILLGLVLLGTFISNKYSGNNQKPGTNPVDSQLPISASEKDVKEIKELAINFSSRHYSYVWGDFSSAESQYENMTDRLRIQEEAKINELKTAQVEQPRKFLTVQADVVDSKIDEYDINKRAVLTIRMNVKEINGALVTSSEVPEIKPYTSGWVESDGKTYRGSSSELVTKKSVKNVILVLVKENNNWKIDSIEVK